MLWHLDFPEVPAATRRVRGRYPTYSSLDERCNACRVYGGRQGPCQSPAALRIERATTGRPCPRVLIDPANVEALELIWYALRDDSAGLAMLFPLLTHDIAPAASLAILRRVRAVAADPAVRSRVALASREAAARAKSDT